MIESKRCTKCNSLKLLSEFYIDRRRMYQRHSRCKDCEKEYAKGWRVKNKERRREYLIRWRSDNPEKSKTTNRRNREKQRGSIKGKLSNSMGANILSSLKGLKSGRHWESLVGYSVEKLKIHLERQFKPGMTWENYGPYWHIDHKIPIAAFNFKRSDDIDFRKCWELKNLQPLESKCNASKGAKVERPFQPSLTI